MFKKSLIILGVCLGSQTPIHAMQSQTPGMTGSLNFYNRGEPFYEFTNFYDAPFTVDFQDSNGKTQQNTWKTSEHYFQGMKFNIPGSRHIMKQIMDASGPREVFNLGRTPGMRTDWHTVIDSPFKGWHTKDAVMYNGLKMKFSQNPQLAALLVSTDGLALVENTENSTQSPKDSYWGNATQPNGQSGENMLGKLLMQVRNDLLTGAVKVDCTKTGVFLSTETATELNRLGHRTKFTTTLNTLCPSGGTQSTQSMSMGQSLPAFIEPSTMHPPVMVSGFGTSIALTIKNRFTTLSSDTMKSINLIWITPNKSMVIHTENNADAALILTTLTEYFDINEDAGDKVVLDIKNNKNVFIPNGKIRYFLKTVLGFDDGFINKYMSQM